MFAVRRGHGRCRAMRATTGIAANLAERAASYLPHDRSGRTPQTDELLKVRNRRREMESIRRAKWMYVRG